MAIQSNGSPKLERRIIPDAQHLNSNGLQSIEKIKKRIEKYHPINVRLGIILN